MIIWVVAQLSPALASWIGESFSLDAKALRELGHRDASDERIFFAVREAAAVIMTKDGDFLRLLEQHGAPPQVIWITCGNTSNAHLKQVFIRALPPALELLEPVYDLAEGRIAALKLASKCSHTTCMLRFFGQFCLALHPLIEIVNGFLKSGERLVEISGT